MQLFITWYLKEYKNQVLPKKSMLELRHVFDLLVDSALQQPMVCVHRDFHSRNLMVKQDGGIGVLDFQDAVWGPVTYDLVSLLKDCYVAWPDAQRTQWLRDYFSSVPGLNSFEDFLRWFDWMGLQRHLKCLGIFARLHIRDKKPGYLADIPRVLHYARQVCKRYQEFSSLLPLLK